MNPSLLLPNINAASWSMLPPSEGWPVVACRCKLYRAMSPLIKGVPWKIGAVQMTYHRCSDSIDTTELYVGQCPDCKAVYWSAVSDEALAAAVRMSERQGLPEEPTND